MVADDIEGNLDRLEQAAAEAAALDADLLITPEMYLTGYNIAPSTARRLAVKAEVVVVQIHRGFIRQRKSSLLYRQTSAGQKESAASPV
mgnify:CR=1 FL=1